MMWSPSPRPLDSVRMHLADALDRLEVGGLRYHELAPAVQAAVMSLTVGEATRQWPAQQASRANQAWNAVDWHSDWEECSGEDERGSLLAARGHEVDAGLQGVCAGRPGLSFIRTGSSARYPVSDCDVTLVHDRPHAGAHEAACEFYNEYRRRHGREPETDLCLSVFSDPAEITARWVPWNAPEVRAFFSDPQLVKRRSDISRRYALARLARELGGERWNLATQSLSTLAAQATPPASCAAVRRELQLAGELGLRSRRALGRRLVELRERFPARWKVDRRRRARNELFCEGLAQLSPVFAAWETCLQRFIQGDRSPGVRRRLADLTCAVDELSAEARLFRLNDYVSRAALKQVVTGPDAVGFTASGPLTRSDRLAAFVEQFAEVGKGLMPFADEQFAPASIRAAKYAVRFWDAASLLAKALGDPVLAESLRALHEQTDALRNRNKDAELAVNRRQMAGQLRRSFKGPWIFMAMRAITSQLIAQALAVELMSLSG